MTGLELPRGLLTLQDFRLINVHSALHCTNHWVPINCHTGQETFDTLEDRRHQTWRIALASTCAAAQDAGVAMPLLLRSRFIGAQIAHCRKELRGIREPPSLLAHQRLSKLVDRRLSVRTLLASDVLNAFECNFTSAQNSR